MARMTVSSFLRHRDGVYRHADVPVGLFSTAREDTNIFNFRLDADFIEGLEETFLIFGLGADNVRDRADELAACESLLDYVAEINFRFVKILRAVIQILRVYKNADTLAFMLDDSHKYINEPIMFKKNAPRTIRDTMRDWLPETI